MYLTTLPKTIDRMFDDFFTNDFTQIKQPKMDIHKTENEYHITVELPGYEQKDIQVNVENNNLKITGEIKNEEVKNRKTIHKEIQTYQKFERNVSLSNQIDVEKISANLSAGVLNLTLPLQEVAKPKQIEIKVV